MKVPASIRNAFDDQLPKYERLKNAIDATVQAFRQSRWHYESRIKTLQSYALKLESGRFPNPLALEDFFACTLVVENLAAVANADALISRRFDVLYRRPRVRNHTHKRPEEFPFDDLRIYVALRPDPALPTTGLEGIPFEFQVKTFLQHAWTIATHDLVYKTDDVNWGKERIAYQTKAMLEHAETSIQEAERLANSATLALEDDETQKMKRTIAILRAEWRPELLPADIRRLATNILHLLHILRLDLDRLKTVLEMGRSANGTHPGNLSPYGTIVQYLLTMESAPLDAYLRKTDGRSRVFLAAEIDIPTALDPSLWVNAIRLN